MQNPTDLVRIVGFVVAFSLAASKFWTRTEPFWTQRLTGWRSRLFPGLFAVLGALPAALQGATSLHAVIEGLISQPFLQAVMAAAALAFPGTHVNDGKATETAKLVFLFVCINLGVSACSPAPSSGITTPEGAAIVIMRGELSNDFDPNSIDGEDYRPVCGGVAVAPNRILTARHCLTQVPVYFVDQPTWVQTTSGKAIADIEPGTGKVATLIPREPLSAWLPNLARPNDGPGEVVRLRGEDIETAPTVVSGTHFSGATVHGDSGSGVFVEGYLVGVVEWCDGDGSDDGVTCSSTGGTFDPVVL